MLWDKIGPLCVLHSGCLQLLLHKWLPEPRLLLCPVHCISNGVLPMLPHRAQLRHASATNSHNSFCVACPRTDHAALQAGARRG